ncbi:MerR family transcriptional regulator [Quadrisphaera sp. INWT6]|uniref:transcriptional regulator FtsR n=1 Tax=Quadrisphaera sp. INWT6 TaxID=2596917 RepID=UPI001892064D|nr:MerR family transcriptional regulator [Quadrisphaera sp. INWT6]MBF5082848.1 MerR family transcriptional regulator [Quadrisphaera sp. INWT6]
MTPPPQGSGAAGRSEEPLLTIGELLSRLAPEFPDVSHSKVRFLEDRGLVSPQRTPSGYRKFAPADVERLRAVLTLQRDQYLPLRVIRAHLDAQDAGLEVPADPAPAAAPPPPPAQPLQPVQPASQDPSEPVAVTRAEALEAAGGATGLLEALEDHGLLPRESAGRYPAAALDLVRAARVLADHGVEPRHLRALRSAVGHEAALVEQVVSPLRRQRSADGDGEAQRVGAELVSSMLALHAAALGCALDPS